MKKIYACALPAIVALFCATVSYGEQGDTWVVKINNEKISSRELDSLYYAHHRQMFRQMGNRQKISDTRIDAYSKNTAMVKRIPTLNKKHFLQELIHQRLLIESAVGEGYTKRSEVTALIKMAKATTLVQYYLVDKFQKDTTVSDAEIKAFYDKNKKRFGKNPIGKVSPKIRQFLTMRKMRSIILNHLNGLKESARIERNMEAPVNR